MSHIRKEKWKKLILSIGQFTESGFQQIFGAGLSTVMGDDPPTTQTKKDWPSVMQDAYESQENIGWDHAFYGRISRKWESVAGYSVPQNPTVNTHQWTGKTIKKLWAFGLELWKIRNGFIHGTNGMTSMLEKENVDNIIRVLFTNRWEIDQQRTVGLFQDGVNKVLNMSHAAKLSWIERIRYLSPEEFHDIVGIYPTGNNFGIG